MSTKTISLSEDTYHRLSRAKGEDESFSDVIDRLLQSSDHPLYDLIGLCDPEDVETMRERSSAFRETVDDRFGVTPDS